MGANGQPESGVLIDMGNALAQVLGLGLETTATGDLTSVIARIIARRYDLFAGPLVPNEDRGASGLSLSLAASAPTTTNVPAASEAACTSKGKPAITTVPLPNEGEARVALRAGRGDAFITSLAASSYGWQQPGGSDDRIFVPGPDDNIPTSPGSIAISTAGSLAPVFRPRTPSCSGRALPTDCGQVGPTAGTGQLFELG